MAKQIQEARDLNKMTEADHNAFWSRSARKNQPKKDYFDALRAENPAKVDLPCLNCNNSTEVKQFNELSTQHKKSAYALEVNVHAFVEKFGLNKVGFLTLTFADRITDPKEAQRRFNSLRKNILAPRYKNYVRVYERQKDGTVHYHLLISCKCDIRTGLNHQALKRRDYRSAGAYLRNEWKYLRENLNKYGFGRAELTPIKSNSKGISKYVSKYLGKHIEARIDEDKGVRLVQFSQGVWKVATSNFQFFSEGSSIWRSKLACWAMMVQDYLNQKYNNYSPISINQHNYAGVLRKYLGSSWAFINRDQILNVY